MGCLALVVSLSSSADALPSHTLIHRGDIAPGAVTAKALAPGAVRAKALARGAVTAKALGREAVKSVALAKEAVDADKLADNAVTKRSLAPGSVYAGALGPATFHTAPIADEDAVAENGTWTASSSATVNCGLGERLLMPSFDFTNPGNREVAFIVQRPFINGDANGVTGRITTNAGGSATAEVGALCLK
jgi:hypothetical protein